MRAGGTYPMSACVQLYNLPLAGVCASLDDDTLRLRNEVTLQRHFLRLQKEAHNQNLLKRQGVLADAWTAHVAASKDKSDEDFAKGWQSARAAALEKAGMSVPFRSWE